MAALHIQCSQRTPGAGVLAGIGKICPAQALPILRPVVCDVESMVYSASTGALAEETVDQLMQRIETLVYDSWRETGMAGADDAAGVYSGVGGVFERDHGDAHCDSRARSDHAES